MSFSRIRRHTGFSLIEVLIAVVVLSVGLLALAALQTSLMRSSSESKSQTAALALAEEQLEHLRRFTDSTGYRTLVNDGTETVASASGDVTYTRTWEVDRFVYRRDQNQFANIGDGNETLTADEITAINANYDTQTEFKRVEVSVGWTDATGAARTVVLSDIVSSISPSESLTVTEDKSSEDRGPQVRISDPADQQGVIPIAVGTDEAGRNQSVAATDPKPQTFGTQGKVSTKFTVQTYVEDSEGFLLQKNFETAVVSCRCERTASTPAIGPYSPSYWDGDKFTDPTVVTGKAVGTVVNAVDQDELCTTCCRDHHDKTGETVLFDPFRPASGTGNYSGGDHTHHRSTGTAPSFTFTAATNAGDDYDEACRLVRVDGIFRVTTDPQLEEVSDLSMSGPVNASFLDDTTSDNYAEFAKDYIEDIWTAIDGGTAQFSLTDYTPSPDGLSQTNPITLIGSGAQHRLTSRAIFIDWISPEAQDKLDCVGQTSNTDCQADFPAYINRTVFQVFPFLTINLSGIGEWSDANSQSVVRVTNEAIPVDRETPYDRGLVTSTGTGTSSVSNRGYRGPSGLTDERPVDPHDNGAATTGASGGNPRAVPMSTSRSFTVSSASAATGPKYVVSIANPASDANLRTTQMNVSASPGSCSRGAGAAGTDPTDGSALTTTEHLCVAPDGTVSGTIVISNFQYIVVTCSAGGASPVDPRDPNTLCAKNNGTTSAATVTQRLYKLCSLVPSNATGGVTFSPITESLADNRYPDTAYATVSFTAPSVSILQNLRFTANFYPETTTCP